MIEYYKSDVAVMINANDPTKVRVMPVALLPEYEEWNIHTGVTEIGKDGIPIDGTTQVITQGKRIINGKLSIVYDAETGKVEGEVLTSIPTTCVIRVETPEGKEINIPDTAEKMDAKAMDALVSEKPSFAGAFADMPTEVLAEKG